jgi:hypothetical protein
MEEVVGIVKATKQKRVIICPDSFSSHIPFF